MGFRKHTTLGRTGLEVSRLGIGAGYGVPARAVERAFHEFGVNYRFVLANPHVDVCLVGPRDDAEMDQALQVLDSPPMSVEELERARRIGAHVHG